MCAGAVHTPHLLQLSGIGNGDTLRHHDVEVRAELPGVGQNLQVRTLLLLILGDMPIDGGPPSKTMSNGSSNGV